MYETVFSAPADSRADILMALLVFAATSHNSQIPGTKHYRDVLTYPKAQRSNRFTAKDKRTAHLHYRGKPMAYPATLATMANHVCKFYLGISSSEFIAEIRRDGMTLQDVQKVYSELLDTTKPEPVIKDCHIEEPATGALEPMTTTHIVHAHTVLSDHLESARMMAKVGQIHIERKERELFVPAADDFPDVSEQVDQILAKHEAKLAASLAAANARFESLIAA